MGSSNCVLAPAGVMRMSLVVNHVLQVLLVVTVSRPLALDLRGVTVTLLLVSPVLVGIHVVVD